MAGPSNFEFFKILIPGRCEEALRLPAKFRELMGARRDLKLRLTGGHTMPLWDVEVFVDERDDMYLRKGLEEFTGAHDLRKGYTLVFRYDGVRGDVLMVTVFDLTCCRMECLHAAAVGGQAAVRRSLPIAEPSHFAVTIKQSNLKAKHDQYLNVPVEFQDAHGYVRRPRVELQMGGRSWTVNIKSSKTRRGRHRSSFRYGWHQFCVDNVLEVGDVCIFHVIREASSSGDEDEEWEPDEEDDEHVLKVEVRKKNGTFLS